MALASSTSPFAAVAPLDEVLRELLAVSLTGVILYTPLFDPAGSGQIVDFTFAYLNPAAQRMMGMPQVPTLTHLGQWPHSEAHGTFAFHVDAFESGEPREYNINYQADGYDNYYRLAARRVGAGLLVSFTDTADQPRSPVEEALRASQARERALLAEAERERALLQAVFTQAPVGIALFQGPDYVVTLANARISAMFGHPAEQVLGRPLLEGVPELRGQGFTEKLDEVARTGVPFLGTEVPAQLLQQGQLATHYFNFAYQPVYDATGTLLGVFDLAVDVTEQVEARQQLEQLNQALETRVQERTQELQHQQAQLAQILGEVPAAIALLTGPEHCHTFFNEAYQTLAGGRAGLDLPVTAVYPEASEQGFIDLLGQVYTTGQPFRSTDWPTQMLNPATGEHALHYLDFLYQPLPDVLGQPQSILVFVVDVTEKVLAHQQTVVLQREVLAATQRQVQERAAFQAVFEQTPALIALLRAPGHRYDYVNPAYQAFFPGRQLVGRDLAEAAPELMAQGFGALIDRVYQTGETFFGQELPFTPPPAPGQPARPGYFNFTYQAYREGGAIVGVSIFAFDVTEQVLARQQRALHEQQLQDLFEQAPVAIGILQGPDYVIEVANPLMAQLWGRTRAEVVDRPLFEALPEVRDQGFQELLDGVRRSGEAFVAEGIAARLRRGASTQTVYLNFVYQPLRDADGSISRVAAVATDVTAQVQARAQVEELNQELAATNKELRATNDELGHSNRQLQRTNADLDNFIYTASHDLKAPISNIEGLLLALGQELPPTAQVGNVPEILQFMHQATERFQRTIAYLTDVSKLQQAHAQAATPVPLAALVEEVRLDLQPLVQQTGAQLVVDVPASARLPFSEKNLRSVVYNLLSNALKYHHPDRPPQVRLRYFRQAGNHVLRVQDNGLGLDLSQGTDKLFGMFQRLHTHVEGSGLGLYMIKKIVDNAGGRLDVQSQLGEGTTFMVYLPPALDAHEAAAAGQPG
ncbi:PAS domain-containing sensor histidine kinase [Hymenobacter sp. HD11105]